MRGSQFIEALEDRRLLSVTAASLFTLTSGDSWSNETLLNGTVSSTSTDTVIGRAKYNGNKCTEVDGTVKDAEGTSTVKDYEGFDKSGNAASYGSVSTTPISGETITTTNTYSPEGIIFPASMNAGKGYTFSWSVSEKTVTTPGGTTNSSDTVKFTVDLTSTKTQRVKVPAGKFNCYLIDETVATTIGKKTTTGTYQLWAAPGYGVIKTLTTSGSTTLETELTSFKS